MTNIEPLEKIQELIDLAKDVHLPVGRLSDGYHTFDDLYEHRCTLFVLLLNALTDLDEDIVTWKSRVHSDGTSYKGWFIAGLHSAGGEQITYHLPDKFWSILSLPQELDKAPEFDGHTPQDVLTRLLDFNIRFNY